ncbi:putative heat shock protein [Aspergillus bombycis]|uniref:Putative heat shock protein n=1 Tax=Aspergillus bombycis TaxID=109264 RepID=A0A1F7ZSZ9_9EURO|nr:putative heat shock protein [Aspergillus bombycis]OGM42547.1 putative heat shock protein [Aspergillus bombycis]
MHKGGDAIRHMGDDEFPGKPAFGFGGRGGRGGRHHHPHQHHHPYAFGFAGHHGRGKFHPHHHKHGHGYTIEHEHGFEHASNSWTKHDRSGPGHPGFHPHHKRGGPGPHFHSRGKFHHLGRGGAGHGRGPGKTNGKGKGKGFHHANTLHHIHPLMRAHHHHPRDAACFMPPVDVFVTTTQTIVHASLPGAQKSDLSVGYDASRSMLSIAGVVHRPGVDEEMHRALLVGERGRHLGVFEREIPVSHGAVVDGVQARLEDGVLKVVLPRAEGEDVQHEDEVEVEMVNAGRELSTPDGSDTEGEHEGEPEGEDEEAEKEFVKVDIQ